MENRSDGNWRVSRRHVLAGTGAAAAGAWAGCLGGGASRSVDGGSTGDDTDPPDSDAIENHPAAAGLDAQPTLGPDPFEAESVIVAFEDPSCPRCRAFEQQTVPQIESELVDPGRAAYAFRGYPVIYPWGEPATQALESTYAASADAFWSLKDHYYATQDSYDRNTDADTVFDRTRAFLAANTDVDTDAVVADAEAMAHDAAVQADLDAGMAAGAGRTTPHVFLFRDGVYVTKAAGSVSFSVVKNALGY